MQRDVTVLDLLKTKAGNTKESLVNKGQSLRNGLIALQQTDGDTIKRTAIKVVGRTAKVATVGISLTASITTGAGFVLFGSEVRKHPIIITKPNEDPDLRHVLGIYRNPDARKQQLRGLSIEVLGYGIIVAAIATHLEVRVVDKEEKEDAKSSPGK